MSQTVFNTDIVLPDENDSISGFFKVVGPTFAVALFGAFLSAYYQYSATEPGIFSSPTLWWLITIFVAIASFLFWYNGNYKKIGEVALTGDAIEMKWESIDRTYHFDLDKVSNLSIMYDGYAMFWGPKKGTENHLSFTHNGNDYNFNFRLADEEAASDMAKVLKSWYAQGKAINETNSNGEARYLMLYSEEARQRLAATA
ncbi:MAG: hypothetical protein ACPGXL_09055 [Chitinophagales bacterium]